MIVFFRRIPEDTVRQDIIDLIEPIVTGKIYQKSGYIEDIDFLTFKDSVTNELEVHALVSIDSDTVAERVIKKFNRKAFKGKHIAVREYHYRSWHNDPRININIRNKENDNKRKFERRGSKIKTGKGVLVKKRKFNYIDLEH